MKNIVTWPALFMAALLIGCSPLGPVRTEAQTEASLRNIHQGQSTREDVLQLLGKPEVQTSFSRVSEDV